MRVAQAARTQGELNLAVAAFVQLQDADALVDILCDVQRPADAVAGQFAHVKRFLHDPFADKGGVAVNKDGHAGFARRVARAADAAGVRCTPVAMIDYAPADAIVATARERHCDLIFMGSHGRSGWNQLLLGSVTNKVLSHTAKPVLVHRLIAEPAAS